MVRCRINRFERTYGQSAYVQEVYTRVYNVYATYPSISHHLAGEC